MNGDLVNFFGTPDGFDTHSVEPQKDYVAIPPGKYPVQIEKSELKQTKAGDGHYLELACVVLDGPAKGRKIWDRLNIDNPSQQAREISQRQFAALGQALGLVKIADTQQLIGGICIACVKVKGDNNEIRTYEPLPTPVPGDAWPAGSGRRTMADTVPPMPRPEPRGPSGAPPADLEGVRCGPPLPSTPAPAPPPVAPVQQTAPQYISQVPVGHTPPPAPSAPAPVAPAVVLAPAAAALVAPWKKPPQ